MMDNNTILHSYQNWLEAQKMPTGKKKTLSAAIELFSQKKLVLVRPPFLNISKPKSSFYQKLLSPSFLS